MKVSLHIKQPPSKTALGLGQVRWKKNCWTIAATEQGVCRISPGNAVAVRAWLKTAYPEGVRLASVPVLEQAVRELREYFQGERREFTLPVVIQGSAFDTAVWQALCEIPYGSVCSYGELARHIGKPGAMRAVGGACGRNPVPIVVPCHRVIGSNQQLTGYACGLPLKQALLKLEGTLLL